MQYKPIEQINVKTYFIIDFKGIFLKIMINNMKINKQIEAIIYSSFKSMNPRTKLSKNKRNFNFLCVF